VYLPHGIKIRRIVIAEFTNVIQDRQTDKPRYGDVCHNKRNRLNYSDAA